MDSSVSPADQITPRDQPLEHEHDGHATACQSSTHQL